MEEITEEEIISQFNNDNEIWPKSDKWHFYTRKRIEKFLGESKDLIEASKNIINAGSSGESYIFPDEKTLHIDLIETRIKNKPKFLVANLEKIPLKTEYCDLIFCVGSTLNYTDATLVIKEFGRLLKKDGFLILEFECSNTLELLFSKHFNSSTAFIKTFYRGNETKIWYYSEEWIKKLLSEFGFSVLKQGKWHMISPLILKLTGNPNFSSLFSIFDPIIKRIYPFKKFSSNMILLVKKN